MQKDNQPTRKKRMEEHKKVSSSRNNFCKKMSGFGWLTVILSSSKSLSETFDDNFRPKRPKDIDAIAWSH